MYNILDFGAVGDGKKLCTVAIQKALDECGAGGGGTVVVPPGHYMTGTIYLRSHVHFHLEAGAELVGSTDMADYNAPDAFVQNAAWKEEYSNGGHLILGLEIEDAVLSGPGIINGNGPAIFGELKPGQRKWTCDIRPAQMVMFCECNGICIQDITMRDSTYWNLFIHGCENVQLRGLRIYNNHATPNGDGIDIDSSRNIVVSDCIIDTGDDAITLRADWALLKKKTPCENIVITNCILKTISNGIRVGVGDGIIRNCVISNLSIIGSTNGICVESRYKQFCEGVNIDNIRLSNVTMDVNMPIYLSAGTGGKGSVRDIYFSNISGVARKGSCFRGEIGREVRNIVLDNVNFEYREGKDQIQDPSSQDDPVWDPSPSRPSALFFSHVNGAVLNNCRIRWGEINAPWVDALQVENCLEIKTLNCELPIPTHKEKI